MPSDYLATLTASQRIRLARDSRDALRLAWPHRRGLRGRSVVQSNVAMLRRLRAF